MKATRPQRVFSLFNYSVLGVCALLTVYPLVYVLAASLSRGDYVVTGAVWIIPRGASLEAFAKILGNIGIWKAYGNSVFYTVAGTALALFVTSMGAYPLSKARLTGRRIISIMVLVTLWFSPGIVPVYLNIRNLGLINSRVGYLIAFCVNAFYFVLLRTFFEGIPQSLEDAAMIDGANDLTVWWKVYVPLSVPALVGIGVYYAVGWWNGYFWAMVLLPDENKIPLQVLLRTLVVQMSIPDEMMAASDFTGVVRETLIYATIVVTVVPILLVYPFIQKYFQKGLMLGSIKS